MRKRNIAYLAVILALLATWQAPTINAAVSRLKTWSAAETLTASNLNAEFNNVLNNGEDLAWPATKAKDYNGFGLTLDADADSTLTCDTDDRCDLALAGIDLFRFDGTVATPVNGIDFIARATGSPASIQAQGSDSNVALDIRDDNGNELIIMSAVASAVNQVKITNAIANSDPIIAATGDSTNIGLNLVSKGSGAVQANGVALPLLSAANIFTANQSIVSTDAGADEGPAFSLHRDSASPAASDALGAQRFEGESSTGVKRIYGQVRGEIVDPTNTSEDGLLKYSTMVAGTVAARMIIEQGMIVGAPTGGDQAAGSINATAVFDDGVLLANIVAASQAEQETGTSTTVNVTPGTQQFHQSASKAWGHVTWVTTTPTLAAGDFNITSISDDAVGVITVTIATDLSGTDYVVIAHANEGSERQFTQIDPANKAVGTFEITILDGAGSADDPIDASFHIYGDH